MHLPTGYHFGVTAATGDLADNHDIISFLVSDPPPLSAQERREIMQRIDSVGLARVDCPPQPYLPLAMCILYPNAVLMLAGPEGRLCAAARESPVPPRTYACMRIRLSSCPHRAKEEAASSGGFSIILVLVLLAVVLGAVAFVASKKRRGGPSLPY